MASASLGGVRAASAFMRVSSSASTRRFWVLSQPSRSKWDIVVLAGIALRGWALLLLLLGGRLGLLLGLRVLGDLERSDLVVAEQLLDALLGLGEQLLAAA